MLSYIVKRVRASISTLLVVYTLIFAIAHLTPGSLWDIGSDRPLYRVDKSGLDGKYHLNDPIYKQFIDYLLGVLSGDFGPSYRDRTQSVNSIIRHFLPVSIQLGSAAMVLAVVLGLPLGALAALSNRRWVDAFIRVLSTLGISMPTYVVVSILIVLLGVELGWVPTFGWRGIFSTTAIVPVFSLALAPLAAVIRYFRSSMLEVMHLDYVRTARAKGVSPVGVVVWHMGRNALVPVVTVIGVYTSYILVGSFFVES